MKIIEHGERKKKWWIGKKLKCKACKCRFELDRSDWLKRHWRHGSCVADCSQPCRLKHGVERGWEVKCPECKEGVVFKGPA